MSMCCFYMRILPIGSIRMLSGALSLPGKHKHYDRLERSSNLHEMKTDENLFKLKKIRIQQQKCRCLDAYSSETRKKFIPWIQHTGPATIVIIVFLVSCICTIILFINLAVYGYINL